MTGYDWLAKFVTVAILAGFSSVILVMLLGQSRVFYAMSQDGLVPKVFSDVHPRYKTPYKSQASCSSSSRRSLPRSFPRASSAR